ncbi:MAG: hypothetical protein M1449_09520 [Candidatus Thermoplasmatota archaeon]|nr:hypothetical protein [Candidatus Thermoplasmatota archaeon]
MTAPADSPTSYIYGSPPVVDLRQVIEPRLRRYFLLPSQHDLAELQHGIERCLELREADRVIGAQALLTQIVGELHQRAQVVGHPIAHCQDGGRHQDGDDQTGHQPAQQVGRHALHHRCDRAPYGNLPGRAGQRDQGGAGMALDRLIAAPHQHHGGTIRLALLQLGIGGRVRQRQGVEQHLQLRHALLDDDKTQPLAVAAHHRVRQGQIEGGGGGRPRAACRGQQPPGVARQEARQQLALAVGDEQHGRVLVQGVQVGGLRLAHVRRGAGETRQRLRVGGDPCRRALHGLGQEFDLRGHHRLVQFFRRGLGLRPRQINRGRDESCQQHQSCGQDQAKPRYGRMVHDCASRFSNFLYLWFSAMTGLPSFGQPADMALTAASSMP